MINIWEYQEAKKIRLTDVNGDVFVGAVVEITDVEEDSEDYGFGEDSITISSEGKHISFPQSEIKSIEVLR